MSGPSTSLPPWAERMRKVFRAGTTSHFVIHGNVNDLVPLGAASDAYVPLNSFLQESLFGAFEVVLVYDRGSGIRPLTGLKTFHRFLESFDGWNGTSFAAKPAMLPRDPRGAGEILDKVIQFALRNTRIEGDQVVAAPIPVAVIMDHAQFSVPRGSALQMAGGHGELLLRLLDWAEDPSILGASVAFCLVTENLSDLAIELVRSPHVAKIGVTMPGIDELRAYAAHLEGVYPGVVEGSLEAFAARTLGLTLVNVRALVSFAAANGEPLDGEAIKRTKRRLIEEEVQGLMDFVESDRTLDDVAGHVEAKAWLREDTALLQRGTTRSVPMGYLFAGRIGTGKTFLATCWAGEIGIPCVVFKNFRDKWQGATEGNLEKIFTILEALGQVLVFVDEADQATGKRGGGAGDSGVSGRVYSMLAKQMSDTDHRGRIIWIFATSRPDLLEVDLKRPGRLDVHIPLFPPARDEDKRELFVALARKVGLPLTAGDIPSLPPETSLGGNEIEAILVRAMRLYDMRGEGDERTIAELLASVVAEYRPSAHRGALEYMDLVAVKECTDARFLPARFAAMTGEELDARIEALARSI